MCIYIYIIYRYLCIIHINVYDNNVCCLSGLGTYDSFGGPFVCDSALKRLRKCVRASQFEPLTLELPTRRRRTPPSSPNCTGTSGAHWGRKERNRVDKNNEAAAQRGFTW